MMKKILILLTGLLLAGGTVRAVPVLEVVEIRQDFWTDWIASVEIRSDVSGRWYIDGEWVGTGGGITVQPRLIPEDFSIWSIKQVDAFGGETTATWTWPIIPTGPRPNHIPDAGATALLLGFGVIGLLFTHRRLHAAR